MVSQTPHVEHFKQQLCASLRQEAQRWRTVRFAKHAHLYTCGAQAETVYFLESGQVKLLMLSSAGDECLLAILTAGDIFGELCLCGLKKHTETAIAMEKSIIKLIPRPHFFACLRRAALLEGFTQYLILRIADQQEVIANLVTANSEQRLGKTLLQLAHKLGKQDSSSIRIEPRISQEELAEMVGTTRSRVSTFMHHFLQLGLIELSTDHFLIVKEQPLMDYLAQGGRRRCVDGMVQDQISKSVQY